MKTRIAKRAIKHILTSSDQDLGGLNLQTTARAIGTFSTALNMVKNGGLITLIGMHASKFEIDNILMMTTNNISVRGVYGYNQDIFKKAINLFAQKKIKIYPILTKRIRLDQVPKIFKILGNPPHEELKILVEFD